MINLIIDIKKIITIARNDVVKEVNKKLLQAYWDIGKTIVENEQDENIRAEYGKNLLKILSKELSNELGKGFSRSNLQNMRNLYLCYPNCQTLSGELSWSHYCELLSISDESKRNFYEKEIINRQHLYHQY